MPKGFTSHSPDEVAEAGSLGDGYAVNRPTLPNVGANFGGTGPYANYVKVLTVPANKNRRAIQVENATGAQIALIRDDGTAANGAVRAKAAIIPLAGGAAAGQQGAGWTSNTFDGRLEIYAPAALTGNAYIQVLED